MAGRILSRVLVVFTLTLPAVALQKERPLPKGLPPYGPLKPFSAPEVKQFKLPNGLTLWMVPRPGFPKLALALAVRSGLAADPKDRPGLSELVLATFDQGTKTRGAKQIAQEIQAAGGDLSGRASPDAIVVSTEVLAPRLESALSLLSDIFQKATFPQSEVDLAKRNAADNLRVREADPSFLASRALARVMFAEHPYGIYSPTQDSIAKTTPEELRHEYSRRFRPDLTLLVAVGDFDVEKLAATIQGRFGVWAAPEESPPPPVPGPPQQTPHAVFLVGRPGSVQTTLAFGALGATENDPDYAAARVANAIYGGMFGSRLITNIREDKGYTYSPGASLQTFRMAGLLRTVAPVRNEVTGAAFNEIEYELNRMATTLPTEEEISRAQRYLIGTRALELQVQSAVAQALASLWVKGLPPEELGWQSERIQQVTAKEVEAAGRKYFPASHQTIVAVGEAKVVKEQLAPFGIEIKPAPSSD